MERIYNIAFRKDWEEALRSGSYVVDSLEREGFIHSSKRDQVEETANRIFFGRTDLVLLVVDPSRLRSPLKYEVSNSPKFSEKNGKNIFPHIFGPLNVDAVLETFDIAPEPDGGFRFAFLD
ncbi:DUF952 domain-containing protein [Leptospira ellisii]|uniref:DUF952 domain-containing protein n=1 Tax=Leptospira ellisii TaxID=2023197 RepID=A0A2N0BNC2_9LEPT|nr:DUF952 domain-containing protein [Leptospira ellisii]MDV6235504.1 DUF952 domain-containing protein [Leptospira ellisii]PJZ94757.1 hypothetical protein CH379_01050 [Leptospira ellisii]PKA05495.1 hypothetical protein CH375_04870 [Leptospira ellisii]